MLIAYFNRFIQHWTYYTLYIHMKKGELFVKEKNAPHERMSDKKGLSATQEVVYQSEFKKADKAYEKEKERKK